MVSKAGFYGGAALRTFSSGTPTIARDIARIWTLSATAPGLSVRLQDARQLTAGGPQFYLLNAGVNDLDVRDGGASIIFSMVQNDIASLWLESTATAAGVWRWRVLPKLV